MKLNTARKKMFHWHKSAAISNYCKLLVDFPSGKITEISRNGKLKP